MTNFLRSKWLKWCAQTLQHVLATVHLLMQNISYLAVTGVSGNNFQFLFPSLHFLSSIVEVVTCLFSVDVNLFVLTVASHTNVF